MSTETQKPKREIVNPEELAKRYAKHYQKERKINPYLNTHTEENHFLMAILYEATGRFYRRGFKYHIPACSELHSSNL